MQDQSWKERFRPWVLERGDTYRQLGRVRLLERRGRNVFSAVEGEELYAVNLRFSGDGLESMACSCPNARDGYACKHMAAVLLELEQRKADADKPITWERALAGLPPEVLRITLRNLAEEDEALRELLLRLYEHTHP